MIPPAVGPPEDEILDMEDPPLTISGSWFFPEIIKVIRCEFQSIVNIKFVELTTGPITPTE